MIRMVTKRMFFDRKAVTGAVGRATRKVFSRFGAFVRTAARSSIRRRKRVSAPGEPPSSHTGLLKRLIFFGYDRQRRSVVIGPQRLNLPGRQAGQKIGDAPEALEQGGFSTVIEGSSRRSRRRRRMRIKARPFMGPAFEKERPKLPAMWAGSLR